MKVAVNTLSNEVREKLLELDRINRVYNEIQRAIRLIMLACACNSKQRVLFF